MAEPSSPDQLDDLLSATVDVPVVHAATQEPDGSFFDPPTAPGLKPPPPPPPPGAPGTWSENLVIPGYELDAPLAHGGMAQVWKARRITSAGVAVPCVIKAIIAGKEDDARFQRKFLGEAEIYARLRHPNLVQVLDVGRARGRLFLVMEWIEGLDGTALIIGARKRKVEIPLRHVIYIVKQTLQGLHHAHTARDGGFVHRDISPGNLLISRDGAVKLADFGVARSLEALSAERTRTVAGKLHYFAPELVTGQAGASVQSDIFALGVTFYELLSCAPLFPRKAKWPALRSAIATFDPHRLIEDDLTLPEGLESLLLRCLAPQPSQRYATALEFLEDINDFAYETGIRLLDAHFADYVQRFLALRDGSGESLIASTRDDG